MTTKPGYLVYDNLDDRKEVYYLLAKLSPRRRMRFLQWCCDRVVMHKSQSKTRVSAKSLQLAEYARTDDSADRRSVLETYTDIWMLCAQYDFPIDQAVLKLTEMVRKQ